MTTLSPTLLTQTTEKLNSYIERGQADAPAAMERLAAMQPVDTIVPASRLAFSDTLDLILGEHDRRMHDNALKQAAARVEIPMKYASSLTTTEWGKRLLAENLRQQFAHSQERVLLRSVGDEVRAVLSDSYRRLDAWPIIEAYAEGVSEAGGVITEVNVSDLRGGLKAILPDVITVNGDPIVLGARLGVSDFGKGSIELSLFTLRLLCLNGMVGERAIRRVHLGKRIADDSMFSERTRSLDSAMMASAIKDVIGAQFNADAMTARKEKVERAAGTEIDPKATFKELGKVLTKAELDAATETFMFGNTEQVPEGRNAWRLANALSWVAKSATNAERAMDLERMAGAVVDSPTTVISAKLLDDILTTHDLMQTAMRAA